MFSQLPEEQKSVKEYDFANLSSSHHKPHLPLHKHEENPKPSSDRLIEFGFHKSGHF